MTVTIDNQECFWPNIFKEIESAKFPLASLNENLDSNQTVFYFFFFDITIKN